MEKKRMKVNIKVTEEEGGFKITFTKRRGRLGSTKMEYVSRSLEEFLTTASIDAVKKLE